METDYATIITESKSHFTEAMSNASLYDPGFRSRPRSSNYANVVDTTNTSSPSLPSRANSHANLLLLFINSSPFDSGSRRAVLLCKAMSESCICVC